MRGWLSLLVPVLALAGCSREDEKTPFFDTRIPPSLSPRFYPPEGWAWGTIQPPGQPAVRYGVAAPTGVPRASVIIAAAAGEPAEVYFETVHDLVSHGFTVWVMDAAPSPLGGGQALHFLIDNVVRPHAGDTVVVAGYDTGALSGLLEAEGRNPRIDGLAIWSPKLSEPLGGQAAQKARMGLGALAAAGEHDWVRPTYDLSGRATLAQAWETANPDLRPGKRPWSWFANTAEGVGFAIDPDHLKAVTLPVLMVAADGDARAAQACSTLPHCERLTAQAGALPLHLAPDTARDPLIKALEGFVDARIAGPVPLPSALQGRPAT